MTFPHTITVWNRTDNGIYTRVIIHNAYWEDNRGVQLRKTGVSSANGILVIIPVQSAPEGFAIRAQNFMLLGESMFEPQSAKELLATGAVMAAAVDALTFGGLPHWEVTGK